MHTTFAKPESITEVTKLQKARTPAMPFDLVLLAEVKQGSTTGSLDLY
jgi:hypothetical protein